MNILISCGGTGGHMYPGLAVAEELIRRGHAVGILLSGRAVENERSGKQIPEGAQTFTLSARRLKDPLFLPTLPASVKRAVRLLRAFHPDVLLAMGSYTSLVPCLAARICRVPVVLHEANAVPGKAVRWLSHLAHTICYAFPEATAYFPKRVRQVDTGVPIRRDIAAVRNRFEGDSERFNLLVMGGSQGADAINEAVVASLALLPTKTPKISRKLRVFHITGKGKDAQVRARYDHSYAGRIEHIILDYANNMPELYAQMQYCVSRAGASSCFELASCLVPSVLIPYPHAAANHQEANARSIVARGGAEMLSQADVLADPWKLAGRIANAVDSNGPRAAMRKALHTIMRPNAAALVADALEAVATPPA